MLTKEKKFDKLKRIKVFIFLTKIKKLKNRYSVAKRLVNNLDFCHDSVSHEL